MKDTKDLRAAGPAVERFMRARGIADARLRDVLVRTPDGRFKPAVRVIKLDDDGSALLVPSDDLIQAAAAVGAEKLELRLKEDSDG